MSPAGEEAARRRSAGGTVRGVCRRHGDMQRLHRAQRPGGPARAHGAAGGPQRAVPRRGHGPPRRGVPAGAGARDAPDRRAGSRDRPPRDALHRTQEHPRGGALSPAQGQADGQRNLSGRKAAASTEVSAPDAISATSFPVAGPRVMPSMAWPVATTRLGTSSKAPMMGRPSGVQGRSPAQWSLTVACRSVVHEVARRSAHDCVDAPVV